MTPPLLLLFLLVPTALAQPLPSLDYGFSCLGSATTCSYTYKGNLALSSSPFCNTGDCFGSGSTPTVTDFLCPTSHVLSGWHACTDNQIITSLRWTCVEHDYAGLGDLDLLPPDITSSPIGPGPHDQGCSIRRCDDTLNQVPLLMDGYRSNSNGVIQRIGGECQQAVGQGTAFNLVVQGVSVASITDVGPTAGGTAIGPMQCTGNQVPVGARTRWDASGIRSIEFLCVDVVDHTSFFSPCQTTAYGGNDCVLPEECYPTLADPGPTVGFYCQDPNPPPPPEQNDFPVVAAAAGGGGLLLLGGLLLCMCGKNKKKRHGTRRYSRDMSDSMSDTSSMSSMSSASSNMSGSSLSSYSSSGGSFESGSSGSYESGTHGSYY